MIIKNKVGIVQITDEAIEIIEEITSVEESFRIVAKIGYFYPNIGTYICECDLFDEINIRLGLPRYLLKKENNKLEIEKFVGITF